MRTLLVTAIVMVVGGVGTWLTAPSNTVVIGASGLVFGFATYLVARGAYTPHAAGTSSAAWRCSAIYGSTLLVGARPDAGRVVAGASLRRRRRRRRGARRAPLARQGRRSGLTSARIPCHARRDGDGAAPGALSRRRRRGGARARLRRLGRRLLGARDPATATQAPAEATATPAPASAAARKGVRLVRIGNFQSPVFVTAPRGDRACSSSSSRAAGSWSCATAASSTRRSWTSPRRSTSGGEQGLLSMAFAPDYASSGLFYVYFTDSDGDQRVVEYKRASADRADAGSARLVLQMADSESNHNGGLLLFGPGGHLYIGTGDGGGGGDRHGARGNAQNLGSLLGKILRIDPRPSGGRAVLGAALEPVRRALRRARRDLQLRPAQPVALLVRPPHARPLDRRRRPERGRGDRLRAQRPRQELRLAPVRGPQPLHAGRDGAGPRAPVIQRFHSKGNCSITGGVVVRDRAVPGALRPLRVRRLLPGPGRVGPAAARAARAPSGPRD